MKFELQAIDPETGARAGLLHTDHGVIETPIFMPVGTVGSVKAVMQEQLRDDIRAQIASQQASYDEINKQIQIQ